MDASSKHQLDLMVKIQEFMELLERNSGRRRRRGSSRSSSSSAGGSPRSSSGSMSPASRPGPASAPAAAAPAGEPRPVATVPAAVPGAAGTVPAGGLSSTLPLADYAPADPLGAVPTRVKRSGPVGRDRAVDDAMRDSTSLVDPTAGVDSFIHQFGP